MTKLHLLAQKRQEKRSFRVAARAYNNYLSFFDYAEHLAEVKYNRAESLFNSDQHLEAGRAYEEIARDMPESKERKDVLFSAIQAYQQALADAKHLRKLGGGLARQGRALVSDPNVGDKKFKEEVAAIVEAAENRELDKRTLEVAKGGEDATPDLHPSVKDALGELRIR